MKLSVLKKSSLILLSLLLCFLFIVLTSRLLLLLSLKSGHFVSGLLAPNFSIGRVSPVANHVIMLEDVVVNNEGVKLYIDRIYVKYSLRRIWQQRLVVKSIVFEGLKIKEWTNPRAYLEKNVLKGFKGQMYSLRRGFSLVLDQTEFCFRDLKVVIPDFIEKGYNQPLTLDFCIGKKSTKLSCQGKVSFEESILIEPRAGEQGTPLFEKRSVKFAANAESVGQDLLVDLKLGHGRYSLSASGVINEFATKPKFDLHFNTQPIPLDRIRLAGHIHVLSGEVSFLGQTFGTLDDVNVKAEWLLSPLEVQVDEDPLLLTQFSGKLNFSSKSRQFSLEKCEGIIDEQLALDLRGDMSLSDELHFSFKASTQRVPVQSPPETGTKGYDLIIESSGSYSNDRVRGTLKFVRPGLLNRQYVCEMNDLVADFLPDPSGHHALKLKTGTLRLMAEEKTPDKTELLQAFVFDEMSLDLTFWGKRTFLREGIIEGYDGRVRLQGEHFLGRERAEYLMKIDVEDLNFGDTRVYYPVYCEVSGILKGSLELTHKDGGRLRGLITAEKFDLKKFGPLDKIADFLGITSIKEIQGAQIVTEFDISATENVIKEFDFDSQNIQVRSNFKLNKEGRLDGMVAISMARKILSESKIFQKLMSLARERNEQLDFVVRLSGYLDSLRTELVESDMRDTLKQRLSERIKNLIEKRVIEAIEQQDTAGEPAQMGPSVPPRP